MSTDRRIVGRYELHRAIASGGMATVHLGRLRGQVGFRRIVAIKRMHPRLAEEPMLLSTLLDEARLASRIQHPNVVATLDMVAEDDELLLVLEYIHGDSLSRLLRASPAPPAPGVVASIMAGVLHGLHAAHEATGETGEDLGLVHRDVSPQNVLVGVDGMARVLDFGVAKARGRMQTTREGQVKGKLAYMAPEQIRSGDVTRRSDLFAAGIVTWEALTGQRLFRGDNEGQVLHNVLGAPIEPPSQHRDGLATAWDDVVMRALQRDPDARWATAREMALAIEERLTLASASEVGAWVEEVARDVLAERAALVAALERGAEVEPKPTADPDAVTQTATIQADTPAGSEVTGADVGVALDRQGAVAGYRPSRWLLLPLVAVLAGGIAFALRDTSSSPGSPDPGDSARVAAAEVSLDIVTTPPGAMVSALGEQHGPTPVTLTLPRADSVVELVVTREGHQPLRRDVTPDKAQRLELTLTASAEPVAAPSAAPRRRPPSSKAAAPKPTAAPSSPFYRFE